MHNIIAIIIVCVSKRRGRGRGPVVPCVVGYPSPPRPCGSLSCGSMCSRSPPLAKARGLAWGGSYADDVLLFAGTRGVAWGQGGGGGIPWGGWGGACDAAPYMYMICFSLCTSLCVHSGACRLHVSVFLSIYPSMCMPVRPSYKLGTYTCVCMAIHARL